MIIQITRIPYGFEQIIQNETNSGSESVFVRKMAPNFSWISDSSFCKKIESIIEKYQGELKPNITFKERLTKTSISAKHPPTYFFGFQSPPYIFLDFAPLQVKVLIGYQEGSKN